MPERLQALERIAFSLVCMSAVVCSAFLAYAQHPEIKDALRQGEALMRESAKYSAICSPSKVDPCAEMSAY
ncbi:hypothetical protein WJ95_24490 [Burkholderia ubonensis]|uniref:Uncharacterized protein n=2 Tax=Burkholderia ubonensis TaxID=101571 RepID=A0A105B9Q4_9BURK|nr:MULTISPECIES: hypothetical protein [Burkholderia]AJX17145.1 hypothetical protein BW23_26 [Burkholderia ubonensis MSMB22]AOK23374.1 hypothetical protein WK67_11815 [Burkholderia ubonensis]AOK59118.1 hypothetical protein WM29_08290 [Burkholderia ubonensis]KIP19430.1 hypothetical protein KY49_3779 [Burkholderia sp. MSHR3999]KVA71169.1 hypothetical protein WM36_29540 [Burkholderia ubonensis]